MYGVRLYIAPPFTNHRTPGINNAHEGFCEDLARQNTVAHLSQLQLRFRRCHIWVLVVAVVS
jgi:hypothetical protein